MNNNIYKDWRLWLTIGSALLLIIAFVGASNESESSTSTFNKDVSSLEIPQYSVLEKREHISTKPLDNKESYFGSVLIEENIENIPPNKLSSIARTIVKKEGLDYNASFYLTEDAWKADLGVIYPKENRDLLNRTGNTEQVEEFRSQEEIDNLLRDGYIGTFKEGEFRFYQNSNYYNQYQNNSN